MKLQPLIRVAVLVTALAGIGVAAGPATATEDHDDHHCPAGYEAERARTGEERARDHNGDGIVCVRGTGDDREIRDDLH